MIPPFFDFSQFFPTHLVKFFWNFIFQRITIRMSQIENFPPSFSIFYSSFKVPVKPFPSFFFRTFHFCAIATRNILWEYWTKHTYITHCIHLLFIENWYSMAGFRSGFFAFGIRLEWFSSFLTGIWSGKFENCLILVKFKEKWIFQEIEKKCFFNFFDQQNLFSFFASNLKNLNLYQEVVN